MSLVTCASIEKEYEKLNNVKRDDIQNLMAWLKGVAHLPHEFITGNSLQYVIIVINIVIMSSLLKLVWFFL